MMYQCIWCYVFGSIRLNIHKTFVSLLPYITTAILMNDMLTIVQRIAKTMSQAVAMRDSKSAIDMFFFLSIYSAWNHKVMYDDQNGFRQIMTYSYIISLLLFISYGIKCASLIVSYSCNTLKIIRIDFFSCIASWWCPKNWIPFKNVKEEKKIFFLYT